MHSAKVPISGFIGFVVLKKGRGVFFFRKNVFLLHNERIASYVGVAQWVDISNYSQGNLKETPFVCREGAAR